MLTVNGAKYNILCNQGLIEYIKTFLLLLVIENVCACTILLLLDMKSCNYFCSYIVIILIKQMYIQKKSHFMVYSILSHLLWKIPGKGNLIKTISYSLLYRIVHICSLGRVPNAVVFRSAHNLPESFLKSRKSKFHGMGPYAFTKFRRFVSPQPIDWTQ